MDNKINLFSPSKAEMHRSLFGSNCEYSIHQKSVKNWKILKFDLLEISQSSPVIRWKVFNHFDPFFIARRIVLQRDRDVILSEPPLKGLHIWFTVLLYKSDLRIYAAEMSAEIRRIYIFFSQKIEDILFIFILVKGWRVPYRCQSATYIALNWGSLEITWEI